MANHTEALPTVPGAFARFLSLFHTTKPQPTPRAVNFQPTPKMHALESRLPLSVATVGHTSAALARATTWLHDQGHSVLGLSSLGEVTPTLRLVRGRTLSPVSHLLVDVDSLGGIARIAEALSRIRRSQPELAVILISAEFEVDDFSMERLPLCDASIRSSFTFASLEFALSESMDVNNPAWQDRLHDLDMSNVVPIRGARHTAGLRLRHG